MINTNPDMLLDHLVNVANKLPNNVEFMETRLAIAAACDCIVAYKEESYVINAVMEQITNEIHDLQNQNRILTDHYKLHQESNSSPKKDVKSEEHQASQDAEATQSTETEEEEFQRKFDLLIASLLGKH